jgi:hypothetical protein
MTPPANTERYKNHRFPGAIISHGVWLYYRFILSYRDVQELLFERGVTVSHEAIRKWALIMASATLYSPSYPTARRGGLRGAGGISTDASMAANIARGFCPKNRSAAVVPSARVRKKLCTAVRHARFLGWSSPRSW